uniref:Uncharacterized protein n=1 Tax=Rhizophora mucronata TaxID=61149 RepID=A0A2P2LR02_RHIMU
MPPEEPSSPPIPLDDTPKTENDTGTGQNGKDEAPTPVPTPPTNRSNRPSRACTIRAAARIQAAQQRAAIERKQRPKREREQQQRGDESPLQKEQCSGGNSKIVTPLAEPPQEPTQLPRWNLRSMWELASILNFLHVSGFWVA